MPDIDSPSHVSLAGAPDRLNGWKDIASFLGKGVRTAQRWEKEFGLPVHRLGREGGEIVFAFKEEVTRWLAETAPARQGDLHANGGNGGASASRGEPPQPGTTPAPLASPSQRPAATAASHATPPARSSWSPRRRNIAAAVTALLAVSAGALWLVAAFRGDAAAPPATASAHATGWRVEDDRLKVFGAGGALLWQHDFGHPLEPELYSAPDPAVARSVVIRDLELDGTREVLFLARTHDRPARRLYAFESDGTLRFAHQPTRPVRFGDRLFTAPWLAHDVFLSRAAGGGTDLWSVFVHGAWFPAVLQRLNPRGDVLSEYWSNGYITWVSTHTWRGRSIVLVGGTNNEHRGASLAIFDAGQVTGSAPAENPRYVCGDCPPGRPLAFVVFPRLCMTRVFEHQASVEHAWVDGEDRFVVSVTHGSARTSGDLERPAVAFYTLGADLTPHRVELTREFHMVHAELRRGGHLDHDFGEADEADFFPLLKWDGQRYVPLPAAPIVQ
jgi:hypothetical protein